MTERESMGKLLRRSSLGTPAVRRLAAATPREQVRTVTTRIAGGHLSKISDGGRATSGGSGSRGRAAATTQLPPTLGSPAERTAMADRKTSSSAAKAASKVLRDGRTGKASKTAAGSALSQRGGGRSGKK